MEEVASRRRRYFWRFVLLALLLGGVGWWCWPRSASKPPLPAPEPSAPPGEAGAAMTPLALTLYFPAAFAFQPVHEEWLLPAESGARWTRLAQRYLSDSRHRLGFPAAAPPPLALYRLAEGGLVVDFIEGEFSFPRSVNNERLFFGGLAKTLLAAAPEVKQIRFLIQGSDPDREAWHIDLRRPFTRERGDW